MRILLVVHGFPPAAGGGTEVYTRNLARALAKDPHDRVMVFARESDPGRPEHSVRRVEGGSVSATLVNNTFQACLSFEESYANPAIARIAGGVLDEWRPDVLHIQHLTCLSTGIPGEAVRRSIPVVMTLNDYWLICHRGQLVDRDGATCAGPFGSGCAGCVQPEMLAGPAALRAGRVLRSSRVPGAPLAVALASRALGRATSRRQAGVATIARLRHMQEAVRGIDLFLAPSRTLHDAFRPFGIPPERLVRCNQGIPLGSSGSERRHRQHGPLRVGFAGGLLATKRADVLLDALDRLPAGSVALDLLGSSDGYHGENGYRRSLAARLGHPAIRRLGPVPHARMAAMFDDLDVLVMPSTWLENAPFTIREAFAAGVPVIASNLGGMAEMVRDGIDGLLFPPGDPGGLAAALRRLIDEPSLLETLRSGIRRPMSIEEDAGSLRQIYDGLIRRTRASAPNVPDIARPTGSPTVTRITGVVLNYRTADQAWLAARSLQASTIAPARVVIVDNRSGDGSVERLRRSLNGVEILEAAANRGFSAGCNLGIRAALDAGADRVLLVNSDAVLAPDAIERLTAAMNADPQIGIAAPVLLSREEPDHVSSAGLSFSERTGRMRHRGAGRRLGALDPVPVKIVDAVSGCAMLIRRVVFERAGLLDEDYFFSFEDLEFCLRARRAGFLTACVQDALAYHEGGRTIGRRSARRVYFATRNHLRLAAATGAAGRPLRTAIVLGLNAAYVLVSPEAPLAGGAAALVRGAWHHFTGRYGPD